MGLCKEYHVFDVLFTPYFPERKNKLQKKIESSEKTGESTKKEQKLLSFLDNPDGYFDHFDRLYSENENVAAVGDMTPSYSMLDAEAYQFILSGLAKRNFTVKVIFIMRDPIERVWSMCHQEAKVKRAIKSFSFSRVFNIGIARFKNVHAEMRTRYERTIEELEKVFPPPDIFYGFYENFFTSKSYSRLADFLGIELKTPDFSLRRNKSFLKRTINKALAKEAAQYYEKTYRYIFDRFGPHVTELWPGYKYLEYPFTDE